MHLLIEDNEEDEEDEEKENKGEKVESKEEKKEDDKEDKEEDKKEERITVNNEEKEEKEENENKEETLNRVSTIESVNGQEEEESESEHLIYRTSKEAGKFFSKIHKILFFQFIIIFILVFIGFYYDFDKIFIDSLKSMLWSFIPITIFTFFLTGFIICYENGHNICYSFNIFIYIPIITIYLYLLSEFVRQLCIIIVLFLFILDFLTILTFILVFKKYKGYGILFFTLLINTMCIFIYYKQFDANEKIEVIIISIIAFVWINYILIFNNIVRQNIEDEEYIGAAFLFNYCIFIPAFIIFLIILLISLLAAIIGIILALLIIVLAFLLIILLFKSLR